MAGSGLRSTTQSGEGKRVAMVAARFHADIVDAMVAAARSTLLDAGVAEADIIRIEVPGAAELPFAAKLAARNGADAVITFGCVIRGETTHYNYVCDIAAQGVRQLNMVQDVPIIFGVLTCESIEQAQARCGIIGDDNKGVDCAVAALEMMHLQAQWVAPV